MRPLINLGLGRGLHLGDGSLGIYGNAADFRSLLSPIGVGQKRAPSPAWESAPWHTSQPNVKDVIQVYKAVAR